MIYVRILDESIQTLTKIEEKNVLKYPVEENLLKLARWPASRSLSWSEAPILVLQAPTLTWGSKLRVRTTSSNASWAN